MRNQNVCGEPAVDRDTEIAIVSAQIFLADTAGGAGPTTDPGINGNTAANDASDFMPECEGQGAPGADIELLVGAEHHLDLFDARRIRSRHMLR
jgi:hypothetical protein